MKAIRLIIQDLGDISWVGALSEEEVTPLRTNIHIAIAACQRGCSRQSGCERSTT